MLNNLQRLICHKTKPNQTKELDVDWEYVCRKKWKEENGGKDFYLKNRKEKNWVQRWRNIH